LYPVGSSLVFKIPPVIGILLLLVIGGCVYCNSFKLNRITVSFSSPNSYCNASSGGWIAGLNELSFLFSFSVSARCRTILASLLCWSSVRSSYSVTGGFGTWLSCWDPPAESFWLWPRS
jgi:hypothetical protein